MEYNISSPGLTESASYDSPQLSSLTFVNGPKTGNSSVRVDGQNFAQYDTTVVLRIGGTAAGATFWISDTSLICLTSGGGFWRTLDLATTVVTQLATQSAAFTFDGPTLTAIGDAFTNCTDCDQFTVLGQGFGHVDNTPLGRLGGEAGACEATAWISESSATCKISDFKNYVGDYTTDGVRITIYNQNGRLSETITYYTVGLSDVFQMNSAPAAAKILTLSGTRFGSGLNFITAMELGIADWSPRARLGASACEFSAWISETSLACKNTQGSAEVSSATISVALGKKINSIANVYV